MEIKKEQSIKTLIRIQERNVGSSTDLIVQHLERVNANEKLDVLFDLLSVVTGLTLVFVVSPNLITIRFKFRYRLVGMKLAQVAWWQQRIRRGLCESLSVFELLRVAFSGCGDPDS
eukprot:TRINITY_DN54589_c0_g2_i1.p3 TRINITY_DN54589_c0_g2~~TRINITY_DN54589_c0_g2_i1.p3  ORF type:complete len:135 (+),score=8.05 TRINITY_DN54589_c0_g2_i1:60-407(+)